MKAISIRQPWASMVVSGEKTIETRTWRTNYRGPLLIVSSKQPIVDNLPRGYALAIVTLVDCRPMTKQDEAAACCGVTLGRFAWVLSNIRNIVPFRVSGKLGLYEVPYQEAEGHADFLEVA